MRLHLVDGTFELFRAHFTRRPGHVAPGGAQVKATVGLAQSLLALLHDREEAVTHLAVAFDNPIRSFRNDLWPGYKSDDGVPAELRVQFDLAEEAVRALGVTVWSMRELEADDALATGASRFGGEVEQVRILTPDKDLGQCLSGRSVVQVDRVRKRELDEGTLLARWGIRPESVPDFLSLMGDDADGYPGVAGFGEKTAGALLARFLHLESIPVDPGAWPAGIRGAAALSVTLREKVEEAFLFRRLATLVRDAPLPRSLGALAWHGLLRERLAAFCDATGLRPLLERLDASAETRWAG